MGPFTRLVPLLLLVGVVSAKNSAQPNFSDLTIKTKQVGPAYSSMTTLYLKGARQRMEYVSDNPNSHSVIITQCDEGLRINLNDDAKLYAELPIRTPDLSKSAKKVPVQLSGLDVNITINSTDTGERQQVGPYEARHVKTTTIVDAPTGASMKSKVEEKDGWYVDIPALYCRQQQERGFIFARFGTKEDRLHFHWNGPAARGYPIEETIRTTQDEFTSSIKTELLSISQDPISASLFERPKDYSPARHLSNGGIDMRSPETLTNRVYVFLAGIKNSLTN
jgi:hypothetical protein